MHRACLEDTPFPFDNPQHTCTEIVSLSDSKMLTSVTTGFFFIYRVHGKRGLLRSIQL